MTRRNKHNALNALEVKLKKSQMQFLEETVVDMKKIGYALIGVIAFNALRKTVYK